MDGFIYRPIATPLCWIKTNYNDAGLINEITIILCSDFHPERSAVVNIFFVYFAKFVETIV